MNKRVQELIDKCAYLNTTYANGIDESIEEFDKQEFAELLIKECISVARAADNGDEVYAWYAIQKHFGTIILL